MRCALRLAVPRSSGGLGAAVADLHQNADHGFAATYAPGYLRPPGLPPLFDPYWDPFWRAAEERGTVICMHIGSSSRMPATSGDAPVAVAATLSFGNAMASMSDWLFSGKLVQFPDVKLAYSEGQIGWIPYILERVDDVWREHRAWGGVKDLIPEPPSTYYYGRIFGCFTADRHGLANLEAVDPHQKLLGNAREELVVVHALGEEPVGHAQEIDLAWSETI